MASKSFRDGYHKEVLYGLKLSQILQVRPSTLGSNKIGIFPCEAIRPGQQLYREKAVAVVDSLQMASQAETDERLLGALIEKVCLENGLLSDELKIKAAALLRKASFLCPSSSKDAHFTENPADHYQRRGFWHRTAMFNHSCVPNARLAFDDKVAILTATKCIRNDQEIVIDYLAHRDRNDFTSPSELQGYFKARWGFTCACQLCSHDDKIQRETYHERVGGFMAIRDYIKDQGRKAFLVQYQELHGFRNAVQDQLELLAKTYSQDSPACVNLARNCYALACYDMSFAEWGHTFDDALCCLSNLGFQVIQPFDARSPSMFAQHGMATKEALRSLLFIWVAYLSAAKKNPKGQHRDTYIETGLAARAAAKMIYRILVGSDMGFAKSYDVIAIVAVDKRCSLLSALERLDRYGGDAVLALKSLEVKAVLMEGGARVR
ncbi:MAG: hypothetical protein Q9202_007113 [Teloschistes flavicans]